ncbi:GNAT family N-acetyltransferase [Pedobacter foliorum]|uniref:GNAT family N-acetyltransferase n=1 Tax=Pedobacter foliorum TaxID=2739058 RepID=UPI0015647B20|nr:GNAT family N-acetyltransferase [Pedobacter foliorum]NRF41118.1 GNAT family N-acetyltransferase [Pedobacter foliorum]
MATFRSKAHFIDILTAAFQDNQSVNYIVQQDNNRMIKIRRLMEYSYSICERFGKVVTTEDGHCCALILFPDQKKFSFGTLVLDLRLILGVTGMQNLFKVLKRERLINQQHQQKSIYYLWFIAVDPKHQQEGRGSDLLKTLIADASNMQRPFYLETSTLKNIPWYEKNGFQVFHELDIGYRLLFLRHIP